MLQLAHLTRILFKARIKNMGTTTQSQMLWALKTLSGRFQEVNHHMSSESNRHPWDSRPRVDFWQNFIVVLKKWKDRKKKKKNKTQLTCIYMILVDQAQSFLNEPMPDFNDIHLLNTQLLKGTLLNSNVFKRRTLLILLKVMATFSKIKTKA